MNTISMHSIRKIGLFIVYPFLCVGQYFIAGFMIVWLLAIDVSWPFKIIFVGIVFLACILISLIWHKTFFVKDVMGLDAPHLIKWTNSHILFKGFFSEIDLPIQNIISYKTIGLRKWEHYFIIKMNVKNLNGKIKTIWITTSFRNKKLFLESLSSLLPGIQERK